MEVLRRKAKYVNGTVCEVSTYDTKLSQLCHNCEKYTKKGLNQRFHQCECGIGRFHRDKYSAWLVRYIEPKSEVEVDENGNAKIDKNGKERIKISYPFNFEKAKSEFAKYEKLLTVTERQSKIEWGNKHKHKSKRKPKSKPKV